MPTTKVLRLDNDCYEVVCAFRDELERRRGCKVSLNRALRELLVAVATRLGLVEAEDQSAAQ